MSLSTMELPEKSAIPLPTKPLPVLSRGEHGIHTSMRSRKPDGMRYLSDDSGRSKIIFLWLALLAGFFPLAVEPAHAGRIEAGSFTAHATTANTATGPVRIDFQQAFDTVPIVVALSDQGGSNSAAIRITNISTTGFDELILEPDNWDGRHAQQNVHYLAVEPGRHVLPDGRIIEAGRIETSAVQRGGGVGGPASWSTVSFSSALPTTPAMVMQIQTANSEEEAVASAPSRPFITAVANTVSATGFQVALERSEVKNGSRPTTETIGWIAFPAGLTGTFPDTSGTSITWSAVNSPTNIAGWDNGCFTNSFGQTSASRIALAKKITRLGGDGGWLRRCSLSSTTIGLRVDEDTARDSERSHTAEAASIIAFSQAFHASLEPSISVSKTSVTFTDTYGSGFALPDARVEYLISVQNSGNAPPNHDSIILTEALPAELSLVIADFGGAGSGPIQYQDGSPASGLDCSFVSFASTSDCFAFSTDGIDFSYQPSDSGDGTDPRISHIRISPDGFMAPDNGSGPTSFTLRFTMKIP